MENKYIYNPELTHIQYLKSSLKNRREAFLEPASKSDLKSNLIKPTLVFSIGNLTMGFMNSLFKSIISGEHKC